MQAHNEIRGLCLLSSPRTPLLCGCHIETWGVGCQARYKEPVSCQRSFSLFKRIWIKIHTWNNTFVLYTRGHIPGTQWYNQGFTRKLVQQFMAFPLDHMDFQRLSHTVPSESIQTPSLFPHFVTLLPLFLNGFNLKILSNLHTIAHNYDAKTDF